jgi:hypothetical protein
MILGQNGDAVHAALRGEIGDRPGTGPGVAIKEMQTAFADSEGRLQGTLGADQTGG